MKNPRFTILFLFIFCVLSLIYSSTMSWAAGEYDQMGSMKMQKCRIISIVEKVNEYTNTIKLYIKMLNNPENKQFEKKMETPLYNKLIGFIQKLQRGNNLKFYTDERKELTDPEKIADYLLGKEGRITHKILFDITKFEINYIEGLDDRASEFAIDCVATVSLKYHLITKENSSGTMNLEVVHMRVCMSD